MIQIIKFKSNLHYKIFIKLNILLSIVIKHIFTPILMESNSNFNPKLLSSNSNIND